MSAKMLMNLDVVGVGPSKAREILERLYLYPEIKDLFGNENEDLFRLSFSVTFTATVSGDESITARLQSELERHPEDELLRKCKVESFNAEEDYYSW